MKNKLNSSNLKSEFLSHELQSEFDSSRNPDTAPAQIRAFSNTKYWWVCAVDDRHKWEATVASRSRGRGCPICSGYKVIVGVNDLQTLRPELAAQWNIEKNQLLSPKDVTSGSSKRVWWNCSKDPRHTWLAGIGDRVRGRNCPFCSGRKVVAGVNDLETINPELAKEWNYKRNGKLLPTQIVPGSNKKVWWVCSQNDNHEWQARVQDRNFGQGCGVCRGLVVIPGTNDLLTTEPALAAEWHSLNNGELKPDEVLAGSHRKVWWVCSKDPRHEWQAKIVERLNGTGCPVCRGLLVIPGVNDLQTLRPDVGAQWDFEKNEGLLPTQVSAGSNKRVWWKCKTFSSHSWRTSVYEKLETDCPVCGNKVILEGFNDLATTNPILTLEWEPYRNNGLSPKDVFSSSHKKVWWQCKDNPEHVWKASIANRNNGSGCPSCSKAGYDSTRKGSLYFLVHDGFGARKIGITNPHSRGDRLSHFESNGWKVIEKFTWEDGNIALEIETKILRWLRLELKMPHYLGREEMAKTGGWTETFSMEGPTNKEVVELIKSLNMDITARNKRE